MILLTPQAALSADPTNLDITHPRRSSKERDPARQTSSKIGAIAQLNIQVIYSPKVWNFLSIVRSLPIVQRPALEPVTSRDIPDSILFAIDAGRLLKP